VTLSRAVDSGERDIGVNEIDGLGQSGPLHKHRLAVRAEPAFKGDRGQSRIRNPVD